MLIVSLVVQNMFPTHNKTFAIAHLDGHDQLFIGTFPEIIYWGIFLN